MRATRLLVAVPAAVLLVAGCGSETIPGTGSPAPAAVSSGATPAGNGIADLPADQILAKARAALAGAKSFRARATAVEGGRRVIVDMTYAGHDATGTVSLGRGQTLELRRLGQTVYLKGSRSLWAEYGNEAVAALLTGKWLKSSVTDERFGQLAEEFADPDEARVLDPEGAVSKGERKTVRGVAAIGLVDGSDGSVLYIATTGPAYPLQVVPKAGGSGRGEFLDYDKPVTVRVPPAELIIDADTLPGG